MAADKLFNGTLSIELKVLMLAVMSAGVLVLVSQAQAQEHSSPVVSASQAQSPSSRCGVVHDPRPPDFTTGHFCLEKTASPNPVKVGEPLTFTIRAFCFADPETNPCDIFRDEPFPKGSTVTDTLPPSVRYVSASASGAFAPVTCGESAGIVTCAPETYCKGRRANIGCPEGIREIPYVETITVIPTQCGTFANTAIDNVQELLLETGGGPVSATFTVVGCEGPTPTAQQPTCPPTTSQELSESRIQSGAASPSTGVSNAGNNANLAPTSQQTTQSGNVANEQGVVQSCSKTGDISFEGNSLSLSPSTTSDVTQNINQAGSN